VAVVEVVVDRRLAHDFFRERTTYLSPALLCDDDSDEQRGR